MAKVKAMGIAVGHGARRKLLSNRLAYQQATVFSRRDSSSMENGNSKTRNAQSFFSSEASHFPTDSISVTSTAWYWHSRTGDKIKEYFSLD